MGSGNDRVSSALEALERQFRQQEPLFQGLDQQLLAQEQLFWAAQQEMMQNKGSPLPLLDPPQSLCKMLSSVKGQMELLKTELRFFNTFLNYINKWSCPDDEFLRQLGSLFVKIDTLFVEIGTELNVALEMKMHSGWALKFSSLLSNLGKRVERGVAARQKKNLEENLSAFSTLFSNLLAKTDELKQEMGTAYEDYLWSHPFQAQSFLHDYVGFDEFIISVVQNFRILRLKNFSVVASPCREQMAAFEDQLSKLRLFLGRIAQNHGYKFERRIDSRIENLMTYVGAVVIDAAHLSCFCWVRAMYVTPRITNTVNSMLGDLNNRIDPTSAQDFLELNLGFLKDFNETVIERPCANDDVEFFVKYLVGRRKLVGVHEPLMDVISFLINKPNNSCDDIKIFLLEIKAVVKWVRSSEYFLCGECGGGGGNDDDQSFVESSTQVIREVRSRINYSLCSRCRNDVILFKLFSRLWMMEAEVFLSQQLSNGSNFMLNVKDKIEALNERVRFLRTFQDSPEGYTEKGKEILKLTQTVASEVTSLYHSFRAMEISTNKLRDVIFKLLVKIVLFNSESLFVDLINDNVSLMVPFQDRLKTLSSELKFLRALVTYQPEENTDNVNVIFKHVEVAARGVLSLCYSFSASKVTEGMIEKTDLLSIDLMDKISLVKVELRKMYPQVPRSCFPKVDGLGFIDSFLTNLREELLKYETCSIPYVKHQIKEIFGDLKFLSNFLKDSVEQHLEHLDLEDLGTRVREVAYEAEHVIESIIVEHGDRWQHFLWLHSILEETRAIKMQFIEASERKPFCVGVQKVSYTSRRIIVQASTPIIDDVVVGLNDQEELIIDQLTRGFSRRDIVSISGMAGIGKTTLAKEVYNHPEVAYHFHIRAWCYVSQVHKKRELLLDVLGDIIALTDNILEMSDEDLELELYQHLKQRRYLVVMDDMWNTTVWDDLRGSFPDDGNGSRILITSRLHDVPLKVKSDSSPHFLRLLSDDESWKLLQLKVFHKEGCPEEFLEVGKEIAKNCKGLALAIVAVAGLLKRIEKEQDCWKQIAKTLSSQIVDDPQTRCRDILELSYNNLPDYLKPCFLYFGLFIEDKDIALSRLIWLWVAEGFIKKTEQKSLEDLAQDYLMDLIGRSLVMVVEKRSNGGVKTCRIHDLLRDLCQLKAKEENFLQLITQYDEPFASFDDSDYCFDHCSSSNPMTYEARRLCIFAKRKHFVVSRPSGAWVRSLIFFAISDRYPRCSYDISFIWNNFKLLRVLDLECINLGNSFPKLLELLVHLRYLAICGDIDSVPSSIAKLWNLETFIFKGLRGKVILPSAIWCMVKLRHVHVDDYLVFKLLDSSSQLHNLVSISSPSFSCGKDADEIIRKMPNLRKLRCILLESRDYYGNCNQFPALELLAQLESLRINYIGRAPCVGDYSFPMNLKKLTLSNFGLPWDQISVIGKLQNLEVLKLLSKAFEGQRWNMIEGEFLKLKFLKLESLNIVHWNASEDHLPNLQQLVLRSCNNLQEVPFAFAEIPTLQVIEVQWCRCVEESVRKIEEEAIEGLKVLINRSDSHFRASS